MSDHNNSEVSVLSLDEEDDEGSASSAVFYQASGKSETGHQNLGNGGDVGKTSSS